jgi:hypothetical protein
MSAVDVVTVPDFRGPAARLFEARALAFLGSWLENAGAARAWPLHLACIGEPPPSVRALAERCGARVTLHEPVAAGLAPTRNKLRGFDVEPRTDRLLLVDTDVFFLGDPGAAAAEPPGIAVVPSGSHRIPLEMWQRVCAALGEPIPEARILCQRGELADRLPPAALHGPRHREPMVPYYNSGVLLAPWDEALVLRKQWEACLDRLAAHFPLAERANQKISVEDQLGFALTLDRLQREGHALRRLPPALHASWLQVMAEVLPVCEIAIYHAVHLLRLGDREHLDPAREVDLYEAFVLEHVYPPGARSRALRLAHRLRGEPPHVAAVRELVGRLRELVARWVVPALSPGV